jgi:pyruvate dehydrogenase E2 component (dihydrolipoamide acetyltransferase)
MMKPILMPQVGQDIEVAILLEWKVECGDTVTATDIVALVESDKATFEVEALTDGVVLKRLLAAGEEGSVLAPIAFVGEPDETVPAEILPGEGAATASATSLLPRAPPTLPAATAGRIVAAPAARRFAREHGIDLATVIGTGPRGRIVREDVQAVIDKKPQPARPTTAACAETEELPFSKIRSRVAERLSHSKKTIPHYYLYVDVSMAAAMHWRKATLQASATKISITDIIVYTAAHVLRAYPKLNAHVSEDKLIVHKHIHVGVAVSVDDGLLVPVVADADTLSLEQISAQVRNCARGARDGLLKTHAVGTFTISNLGMYGVDMLLPIINPPECAILGVGAVSERPCVTANGIASAPMMTLSLACDHRAVDGSYAAGFLQDVKQSLERFDP